MSSKYVAHYYILYSVAESAKVSDNLAARPLKRELSLCNWGQKIVEEDNGSVNLTPV